jgi:hypothetical protein
MGQGLWLQASRIRLWGGRPNRGVHGTKRARSGLFEMECLPGFARSPDGLAIAGRTAEMVAETREAIRQSQQTIDETRELMRRLDLVIERERVLKRT